MAYAKSTIALPIDTDTIEVPFPYLAEEDVTIAVGAIVYAPADVEWLSAGIAKLPVSYPAGTLVTVERNTPIAELTAVFSPSEPMPAEDLNKGNLQALFGLQEIRDGIGDVQDLAEGFEAALAEAEANANAASASAAEAEASALAAAGSAVAAAASAASAAISAASSSDDLAAIGPAKDAALDEIADAEAAALVNVGAAGDRVHFLAYRAFADLLPIVGPGTVTLKLSGEVFDSHNCFTPSTGKFKPPAGVYRLTAKAALVHTDPSLSIPDGRYFSLTIRRAAAPQVLAYIQSYTTFDNPAQVDLCLSTIVSTDGTEEFLMGVGGSEQFTIAQGREYTYFCGERL